MGGQGVRGDQVLRHLRFAVQTAGTERERKREITRRVKMEINECAIPDSSIFTHHKTAHVPVNEL